MSGRRDFLRGLVSLPLIGGGVSLIGAPTASAEPVTDRLLWSYKEWLFMEHRMLSYEMAEHDVDYAHTIEHVARPDYHEWHFQWNRKSFRGPAGWIDAPQPSTRAALVLSAVGCDWREATEGRDNGRV